MTMKNSSSSSQLMKEYKGKKGNYIKSFLINDDINGNLWQSEREKLKKWIGKPGIVYVRNGGMVHSEYGTKAKSLKKQERYRVTTILDAGTDTRTGNKYVIEEVHDDGIFERIKSGEIKYRSPSVWPDRSERRGFVDYVLESTPLHLAFVDVPAYGEQARVSGTCTGTETECRKSLAPLVASVPLTDGTVDSRSEFVRTIPFTTYMQKNSKGKTVAMTSDDNNRDDRKELKALLAEREETKRTVEELKAEIDELRDRAKNGGRSKSADGHEDEDDEDSRNASSDDDDDDNKTGKRASEDDLKRELEDVKSKNASLTRFATKGLIDGMMDIASANGTPEKQLVAMRKQFEGMDIRSLQKTKALIASFNPTVLQNDNHNNYYYHTEVPNPARALSASLDGTEMSDDELLRGLYS